MTADTALRNAKLRYIARVAELRAFMERSASPA
jgi:hypothetical protein